MRLLFYRVGEPGRDDMIYTDAGGRAVAWRVDRHYTVDSGSKAERRALRGDGAHTLLTEKIHAPRFGAGVRGRDA